jgi:hypothetical protein
LENRLTKEANGQNREKVLHMHDMYKRYKHLCTTSSKRVTFSSETQESFSECASIRALLLQFSILDATTWLQLVQHHNAVKGKNICVDDIVNLVHDSRTNTMKQTATDIEKMKQTAMNLCNTHKKKNVKVPFKKMAIENQLEQPLCRKQVQRIETLRAMLTRLEKEKSDLVTYGKIQTKHPKTIQKEDENSKHTCADLLYELERDLPLEYLRVLLEEDQPSTIVDHGYKMEYWKFDCHLASDINHLFSSLDIAQIERTTRERLHKMYYRGRKHNHEDEYISHVKRQACLLQSMPFIRMTDVRKSDFEYQTRQMQQKHLSSFQGAQLEHYLEHHLPILPNSFSFYVVDMDYKLLYLFFASTVPIPEQRGMYLAALLLAARYPKKAKQHDQRHKYDPLVQTWHLLDWSMCGHPNIGCIAKDALGGGDSFKIEACIKLASSFSQVRMQMTAILEIVAPDQLRIYSETAKNGTIAYKRLLRTFKYDAFLGSVINTGQCAIHRDWKDAFSALSAMTPIGHWIGGDIVLPQLGLRQTYASGDIVICPTQLLQHYITEWRGVRFGTVHCSHNDRLVKEKVETATIIQSKQSNNLSQKKRKLKDADEDYCPPKTRKRQY